MNAEEYLEKKLHQHSGSNMYVCLFLQYLIFILTVFSLLYEPTYDTHIVPSNQINNIVRLAMVWCGSMILEDRRIIKNKKIARRLGLEKYVL